MHIFNVMRNILSNKKDGKKPYSYNSYFGKIEYEVVKLILWNLLRGIVSKGMATSMAWTRDSWYW